MAAVHSAPHNAITHCCYAKQFYRNFSKMCLAVALTSLNLQTKRKFFLLYAIVTADLADCCLPHQQQLFKNLFVNFISLTDLDQRGGKGKRRGNLHLSIDGEDLTQRHSFPASSWPSLASFPLSAAQK